MNEPQSDFLKGDACISTPTRVGSYAGACAVQELFASEGCDDDQTELRISFRPHVIVRDPVLSRVIYFGHNEF